MNKDFGAIITNITATTIMAAVESIERDPSPERLTVALNILRGVASDLYSAHNILMREVANRET